MKYLWIGLFIAALLVVGCFWSSGEIGRRAGAVAAPLEEALDALRAGDAARARTLAAQAAAEWERQEDVLASLLSHERTNGIGEALAELDWLDEAALGRSCERLLRQIRELKNTDTLRFSNIL